MAAASAKSDESGKKYLFPAQKAIGRPLKHSVQRAVVACSNFDGIADGVALTLNMLVDYLQKCGIEVLVLTCGYDEPQLKTLATRQRTVPGIVIQGKYQMGYPISSEVIAELEEFDPQVIHCGSPCPMGVSVMRWAKGRGGDKNVPCLITFHTDFASYLRFHFAGAIEPALWWYFGWFYSHADRLLAPSRTTMLNLAEKGFDSDVLGVWGRGVDMRAFSPSKRSLEWRRSIGVADDDIMVLFVGRLVKEKNLVGVNATYRKLTERGVKYKGVVVGEGQSASTLTDGLPDDVQLVGFMGGDDLCMAYASGDVFYFPSPTETFGRVTIEAMASGLPVVGAAGGGTLDILTEGEDGYLCDPDDYEEQADRLEALVNDSELRNRMAARALRNSRDWGWEKILQGMVREYDRLAGFVPYPYDSSPDGADGQAVGAGAEGAEEEEEEGQEEGGNQAGESRGVAADGASSGAGAGSSGEAAVPEASKPGNKEPPPASLLIRTPSQGGSGASGEAFASPGTPIDSGLRQRKDLPDLPHMPGTLARTLVTLPEGKRALEVRSRARTRSRSASGMGLGLGSGVTSAAAGSSASPLKRLSEAEEEDEDDEDGGEAKEQEQEDGDGVTREVHVVGGKGKGEGGRPCGEQLLAGCVDVDEGACRPAAGWDITTWWSLAASFWDGGLGGDGELEEDGKEEEGVVKGGQTGAGVAISGGLAGGSAGGGEDEDEDDLGDELGDDGDELGEVEEEEEMMRIAAASAAKQVAGGAS